MTGLLQVDSESSSSRNLQRVGLIFQYRTLEVKEWVPPLLLKSDHIPHEDLPEPFVSFRDIEPTAPSTLHPWNLML